MDLTRFEKSIIAKMEVLFGLIETNEEDLREHTGELFSADFMSLTKVFMNVERGLYTSYDGREDQLESDLKELNCAYKFQKEVQEKGAENAVRTEKEDEAWVEIDKILTKSNANNHSQLIPAIKVYKNATNTGLKEAKEAVEERIQTLTDRGVKVTGYDMNGKRILM